MLGLCCSGRCPGVCWVCLGSVGCQSTLTGSPAQVSRAEHQPERAPPWDGPDSAPAAVLGSSLCSGSLPGLHIRLGLGAAPTDGKSSSHLGEFWEITVSIFPLTQK